MSEKRNEIIEEQRKAREEFLRLKKMQSGEIEPEAKPSGVAIVPKTFGDKLKNFWYHFKIQTIVAAVIVAVLAIVTVQCATKEKYDFEIMYFAYKPAVDLEMRKIEEYFEQFAEDVNGDGEVNVLVHNCSVTDSDRDAARNNILQKVQSIIIAERTISLYLVDQKAVDYFDNALDYSIFASEPQKLGEDFYNATKVDNFKLPEGLRAGLRIIKGTTFEGKEDAEEAYSAAEKVLEKIKKQNG